MISVDVQGDGRPYEAPVLRVVGTVPELTKDHKKKSGASDGLGGEPDGISHGDSLKP